MRGIWQCRQSVVFPVKTLGMLAVLTVWGVWWTEGISTSHLTVQVAESREKIIQIIVIGII